MTLKKFYCCTLAQHIHAFTYNQCAQNFRKILFFQPRSQVPFIFFRRQELETWSAWLDGKESATVPQFYAHCACPRSDAWGRGVPFSETSTQKLDDFCCIRSSFSGVTFCSSVKVGVLRNVEMKQKHGKNTASFPGNYRLESESSDKPEAWNRPRLFLIS